MKFSVEIEKHMPVLQKYAMENDFIIEVGPLHGCGSTYAFIQGFKLNNSKNRLYFTVDFEDALDYPPEFDFYHKVIGDSREQATIDQIKKVAGNRKADVIFIDTIHEYEFLQKELEMWSQVADRHTVWIFHDTYMFGFYNHMTDAIKEYAEKNNLVYSDISTDSHGLGYLGEKPYETT